MWKQLQVQTNPILTSRVEEFEAGERWTFKQVRGGRRAGEIGADKLIRDGNLVSSCKDNIGKYLVAE